MRMKQAVYVGLIMIAIMLVLPYIIVTCGNHGVDKKQKEVVKKKVTIKVYIAQEDKVKEMDLEEYVKGVVAAEMPAEFAQEAIKAQAIAARTYAFARMKKLYVSKNNPHESADVCTNEKHCQAWISKQNASKKWGILSSYKYWNKISRAVDETKGIIITYNGKIINPVFHANSGGRTENAEDVWQGVSVDYLKSVPSMGEDAAPNFKTVQTISITDFISKLKSEYPEIKVDQKNPYSDIKIVSHSSGGRVSDMTIGSVSLKGTDFRRIFSLKSANYTIDKSSNALKITTIGNGHGVGMSQWGANYMAKNNKVYEEILKYYYTGVSLSSLDQL